MSIICSSHCCCVHILIRSRMNLVCVKRSYTSRYNIEILRFTSFLIRRHGTCKATHLITISLLMLRISGFKSNIFGIQRIILLILISFTRCSLFPTVCALIHD